jgi:hypothetical protein
MGFANKKFMGNFYSLNDEIHHDDSEPFVCRYFTFLAFNAGLLADYLDIIIPFSRVCVKLINVLLYRQRQVSFQPLLGYFPTYVWIHVQKHN